MTKKNIAAMNEMDKVSGGMIWQPGMPTKPVPGGLYTANERPNPLETSAPDVTKVEPTTQIIPGGKTIDIPKAPDSPWPHCGNY